MMNLLPLVLALPVPPVAAPGFPMFAQDGDTVPAVQEVAAERLFPLATENLVFEPDDSLEKLTLEYARVTGQSVMLDEETRTFLSSSRVGLSPGISVPPDRVQATFEKVMIENGFVMQVASSDEPRIFSLSNINTGNRTTLRSSAAYVAEDNLEAMASHPAILFQTTLYLPNTDVRQMSNSMRTMITDANTQQMLPGGASNSMVLVGFGTSIHELATMLKTMDREAGLAIAKRQFESRQLIERFEMRHAVAADCPAMLAAILGPEGGEEPSLPEGSRVVADQRTNSLLVRARADQMEDFKRAIELLDAKSE